MRPRRVAAEFQNLQYSRRMPLRASMRPRRVAAEFGLSAQKTMRINYSASMRPRRVAAEFVDRRVLSRNLHLARFNEAAASRRGIQPSQNLLSAHAVTHRVARALRVSPRLAQVGAERKRKISELSKNKSRRALPGKDFGTAALAQARQKNQTTTASRSTGVNVPFPRLVTRGITLSARPRSSITM